MAGAVIEILDSSDDDVSQSAGPIRPAVMSRTTSQITDLCSTDEEVDDDDRATIPPSSQLFEDWTRGPTPVTDDDDDLRAAPVSEFFEPDDAPQQARRPSTSSPSKRKSNEDHGASKTKKKRRSADDVQRDKETKAKEREAAKKAKQDEKRRLADEKKAKREANKLHTDKKTERCDMTFRVPLALAENPTFAAVLDALEGAMSADGGATFTIAYDPPPAPGNTEPQMIRWERRARATYDAAAREWVPCAPKSQLEDTAMLFASVSDVSRASFRLPTGRETGTRQVFLMVYGPAAGRAAIEPTLARAQIAGVFVVPVSDARDAAERIVNITGDIAVRPYKILEMTHLPFTPDLVAACSGRGERAAYVHMLTQIPKFTTDIAKSIAATFPTLDALLDALERAPNERAREALFVGLPLKLANPGGPKIGPARARHLIDILLAEDPLVTIG